MVPVALDNCHLISASFPPHFRQKIVAVPLALPLSTSTLSQPPLSPQRPMPLLPQSLPLCCAIHSHRHCAMAIADKPSITVVADASPLHLPLPSLSHRPLPLRLCRLSPLSPLRLLSLSCCHHAIHCLRRCAIFCRCCCCVAAAPSISPLLPLLSSVVTTTRRIVRPPPIVASSTTRPPLDNITTAVATVSSSSPHPLS